MELDRCLSVDASPAGGDNADIPFPEKGRDMGTVVRFIAVIAVMAGALSFGEAPADDPGRALCFELADGTVITGRIEAKVITIRIENGNVLKVPVADLKELTVGLKNRAKPQCKIRAGETTLLGTVAVKEFRIASPYGRVTVQLSDVRRLRPAARAARSKLFGRWDVELRDGTHLRGIATGQSLRVRSRYGIMVVPVAQIQKATFAFDRKSVRVECRTSDRIVGSLGPKTTISLKTDKGRVDLSAGSIAVMFYRTFMLNGHSGEVSCVAFSPDGKRLASGSWDKTIKLWDTHAGTELLTLKGHSHLVVCVAFSRDGKRLASGSTDKTIKLWDTVTGKELLTLKGHLSHVNSVAFSPDGKRLASGNRDKTIKFWDTATGKELLTLKGHSAPVFSIAFSPDGKRLASGSLDKTIKFWDAVTGKELFTLTGHSDDVYSIAFSPDGKRLASGSWDKTIKIWDTTTGNELLTLLERHSTQVFSVAFSPDGKRLASGSLDHTIKLWDTHTGKNLLTFKGHAKLVYSVDFSPDGKHLASGSEDKTIKIWDVSDWSKAAK